MSNTISEEEHHEAFVINRERWLHAPTKYKNRLYNAYTHNPIKGRGGRTPDGNYEMLPDKTLVNCHVEDQSGNVIKKNVYAAILDQREFYDMILYCVEYPINSTTTAFTRATQINWPLPNVDSQNEQARQEDDSKNLCSAPPPSLKAPQPE